MAPRVAAAPPERGGRSERPVPPVPGAGGERPEPAARGGERVGQLPERDGRRIGADGLRRVAQPAHQSISRLVRELQPGPERRRRGVVLGRPGRSRPDFQHHGRIVRSARLVHWTGAINWSRSTARPAPRCSGTRPSAAGPSASGPPPSRSRGASWSLPTASSAPGRRTDGRELARSPRWRPIPRHPAGIAANAAVAGLIGRRSSTGTLGSMVVVRELGERRGWGAWLVLAAGGVRCLRVWQLARRSRRRRRCRDGLSRRHARTGPSHRYPIGRGRADPPRRCAPRRRRRADDRSGVECAGGADHPALGASPRRCCRTVRSCSSAARTRRMTRWTPTSRRSSRRTLWPPPRFTTSTPAPSRRRGR